MRKPTSPAPNRLARRTSRASQKQLPIFTDPNFVRVFADQAVIMALGHDVDIAFVAAGPRLDSISSRSTDTEGVSIKMTPSYSEVARVRMPPAAAAVAAVTIIQKMIEQGYVNKAGLLDTIGEFEEPMAESEDEVDAAGSDESAVEVAEEA